MYVRKPERILWKSCSGKRLPNKRFKHSSRCIIFARNLSYVHMVGEVVVSFVDGNLN